MSTGRRMGKETVAHIHHGISATKNNTFESVLMRWLKPEPIIQSEVSHKQKHEYINAYIWNLERWE